MDASAIIFIMYNCQHPFMFVCSNSLRFGRNRCSELKQIIKTVSTIITMFHRNSNRFRNNVISILSLLFVFPFIHQCQANLGKQNAAFCKAPAHSPNFDVTHPYQNEVGHPIGWHFLLGNPMARQHISALLRGRNLTAADDFTGLCARAILQNGDNIIGGQYRGHGPNHAQRKCAHEGGILSCELISFYTPEFRENAKIYITYIGEKGYKHLQVAVYCFDNGDVGWILGALRKSITDSEKEIILNHVSSLGFDRTEAVPLWTEYCDILDAGKSYWYPSFPFYHPHPVTPAKGWTSPSADASKGWGESDMRYGWGASSTYLPSGGWGSKGWAPPPTGWAPPPTGWVPPPKGWTPPPPSGWSTPPAGWSPPPKGWVPPPIGWSPQPKGWSPPDPFKGSGWPAPPEVTKGWGWPAPDASKGWGWPAPSSSKGWGWPASDSNKGWGWSGVDYNKPWGPPNYVPFPGYGWGASGSTKGWGWTP